MQVQPALHGKFIDHEAYLCHCNFSVLIKTAMYIHKNIFYFKIILILAFHILFLLLKACLDSKKLLVSATKW